jgi:hypothetical protein
MHAQLVRWLAARSQPPRSGAARQLELRRRLAHAAIVARFAAGKLVTALRARHQR